MQHRQGAMMLTMRLQCLARARVLASIIIIIIIIRLCGVVAAGARVLGPAENITEELLS